MLHRAAGGWGRGCEGAVAVAGWRREKKAGGERRGERGEERGAEERGAEERRGEERWSRARRERRWSLVAGRWSLVAALSLRTPGP